ncbi:hypothetical protein E0494_07325 [Marinilabiliaceae bacterium JC040]|nr:hypothetical protein [Marinilabiliaceae bacterium JC040]
MKRFSKAIAIITALIASSILIYSCGTAGLTSQGKDEYHKMKKLHSNKEYLAAIEIATNLVIETPEAKGPKKFIIKHFDTDINRAKQRLNNKPNDSKEAIKQFNMYCHLVKIYDNLNKIALPLTVKKDKWNTEIINYASKKIEARKTAYNILISEAKEFTNDKNYQKAVHNFRLAIKTYLPKEISKDEATKLAYTTLFEKANSLANIENIESAIAAFHFYESSEFFAQNETQASQRKLEMKKTISSLYVKKGVNLEKSSSVSEWEKAIKCYSESIKWNSENNNARENKSKCIAKITEHYYKTGTKLERRRKNKEAIKNYEIALKWTAEYKDCIYRMHNIIINEKISNINNSKKQYIAKVRKFKGKVKKVNTSINKSYNTVHALNRLTSSMSSLSSNLSNLSSALEPFNYVPVVGVVCKGAQFSVDNCNKGVAPVSSKLSSMQKPILSPMEHSLNNSKTATNKITICVNDHDKKMKHLDSSLKNVKTNIKEFGNDVSKYTSIEKDLDKIESILNKLNSSTNNIDKDLNNIYKPSNIIDNYEKYAVPAAKSVSKVSHTVNKIKPTVNGINKVLNKKIGYKRVSFTINKVLKGAGGIFKKPLNKIAKKALKPVLNKLGVKLPTIPGLREINQALDNIKRYYRSVDSSSKRLLKQSSELYYYSKNLDKYLRSIESPAI